MKVLKIFIIPIIGTLVSSCLKDNAVVDQTTPQFTLDTSAIAAYLKQSNIEATKLPVGIWFIVDSATEGIHPAFSDSIKLKYTTKLLSNNSILDQSTTPKHFVLDSLLSAIQVVLHEFQAGSKGRIFIPSEYTNNGNWIFEFQLTDVKDYQLKLDDAIIDAYLSTHSINAIKDPSGLRFTVDTLVTRANTPLLRSDVQLNYTTKTLLDGAAVDHGSSVTFPMLNLVLGLQIGLQRMPEGSTFTFYVPSSLAYGSNGSGNAIKSNANLTFNVKLVKVTRH